MTDVRIDCQIDVPIEQQGGNFADAFRVTPLESDEYILDFLSLSPCRTKASVVARIRVEKKFLASIRDRLESTLEEIQNITRDRNGGLSSKQVEEMWSLSDEFPAEGITGEGALPLAWFITPPEKVN